MKKGHRKLLIVLSAIAVASAILLAILIPNVLDTLEKAKHKRCLGDVRSMGTAYFFWLTEYVDSGAEAASESRKSPSREAFLALPDHPTAEEFLSFLDPSRPRPSRPRPLRPDLCPIEICLGREPLAESSIRIRMPGPNGVFEECPWDKAPVDQLDSCGDDILWADGFFVSYPAGAQAD